MQTAFKEWAVVVDALGHGTQILTLRKGGIAEGRGGFHADHSSFLLFPTLFHQQRNSVVPSAQNRFDELKSTLPPVERVRLEYWAETKQCRRLENLSQALSLSGLHVWTDDTIASRFEWGREEAIWLLALRIHRLAEPLELPVLAAYGGCKSWIELAVDVATEASDPVLTDTAWTAQMNEIDARLNRSAQ